MPYQVTDKCKKWLASLVISSIESVFAKNECSCPEIGNSFSDDERSLLSTNLGCFVTLKIRETLRGCIGSIVGYEPLYQNVWRMARQAAFSDPRFPPLRQAEWPECSIEISILTEATLCTDMSKIEIGKHGLILQYRGRTGVFLPQVPVEQGWNLDEYLQHLCLKAGVPQGSHMSRDAKLFWYEATVFPVER